MTSDQLLITPTSAFCLKKTERSCYAYADLTDFHCVFQLLLTLKTTTDFHRFFCVGYDIGATQYYILGTLYFPLLPKKSNDQSPITNH